MATKYALVSEKYLRQMREASRNSHNSDTSLVADETAQNLGDSAVSVAKSDHSLQGNINPDEYLELLPKRYRSRGKILLQYLMENQIGVTSKGRVVYGDGSIGSHLIDLIKYYLHPQGIPVSRPSDSTQFGLLLQQIDVPNSALGRSLFLKHQTNGKEVRPTVPSSISTNGVPTTWKHLRA